MTLSTASISERATVQFTIFAISNWSAGAMDSCGRQNLSRKSKTGRIWPWISIAPSTIAACERQQVSLNSSHDALDGMQRQRIAARIEHRPISAGSPLPDASPVVED